MDTSWFLSLLPALILLLLALIARQHQKSWLAPGAFFALAWTVFTLAPLLLVSDYYIWPIAVWWIVICATSVYVGSVVGFSLTSNINHTKHSMGEKLSWILSKKIVRLRAGLPFLILLCSLLGFVVVFLTFKSRGESISSLFIIERLVVMSGEISIDRYQHDYNIPFSARILTSFIYAGGFLGGVLFALSKTRRHQFISFLPFVPALILTIVLTTKASILFTIIFFVSAYLSTDVLLHDRRIKLFNRKRLVSLAVIIPLLFMLFIFVQMFRVGQIDWDMYNELYHKIATSFFGHLGAFSFWLERAETIALSLGAYTFAGIYDLFDVHKREMGLFAESVEIAAGEVSNVYTVLRALAEDFTFPGSVLILFLLGVVAGRAYRGVISGNLLFLSLLALFYAFTLWSHVTSILNYNSIIVGYLLFAGYVFKVNTTKMFRHPKNIAGTEI